MDNETALYPEELKEIIGLLDYLNAHHAHRAQQQSPQLIPEGFVLYDSNGENTGRITYEVESWIFIPNTGAR